MKRELKEALIAQMGSRCRPLGDGRLLLSPSDETELRLILARFHTAGETLGDHAELARGALGSIGSVDQKSALVEAEAGASLGAIDRAARPFDLTVGPISPHAATLNLAMFLEGPYAGLRAVLGGRLEPMAISLEALLPDGIPFTSKASPRSAAGPDLDSLILGGEGAFGWVVRAKVRLLPKPVATRRTTFSFPDAGKLARSARRILAAGCAVQRGWAQPKQGRHLLALELGGSADAVERDLSTCWHEASEQGGRPSEQALEPVVDAVPERELSWEEIAEQLRSGTRLSLYRLCCASAIAVGASAGRELVRGAAWNDAATWNGLRASLHPPLGGP